MAMWASALTLLLAPGALAYSALLGGPRGARGAPLALRHARASTSVMQYDDYNDYDDGYNSRGRTDTYERDPNDNAEVDVAAVEQLIAERTECRRDRDFDSADRIRDQLRTDYSVTVYDRDMMWFVQSDRGGYSRGGGGYGRGGGGFNRRANYERDPNDNAEVDVARVEQLVSERADCRSDRDFTSADAIRDELRSVHGVTVSDREMTWCVGNSYSYSKPRYQSQPRDFGPLGHDYTFIPAADEGEEEAEGLDDELTEKINGILAERLAAKFARRFDEADAAREKLEEMGVKVQDKAREWRYRPFVMPDYGPLGHDYRRAEDDAKEIDEASLEKINALLAQRLEAKLRTTYAEADRCKDELAETYNVRLPRAAVRSRAHTDAIACASRVISCDLAGVRQRPAQGVARGWRRLPHSHAHRGRWRQGPWGGGHRRGGGDGDAQETGDRTQRWRLRRGRCDQEEPEGAGACATCGTHGSHGLHAT